MSLRGDTVGAGQEKSMSLQSFNSQYVYMQVKKTNVNIYGLLQIRAAH